MSSILQALKKAEQDDLTRREDKVPTLQFRPSKKLDAAARKGDSGFRALPGPVLTAIVCGFIFLGIGTCLFFLLKTGPAPVTQSPATPNPSPSPRAAQETKMEPAKPVHPEKQIPLEKPPEIQQPKEVIPPEKEIVFLEQNVKIPPDPIEAKTDPIELRDSDLVIQAISWSERPEDRIAVIDSKIVGENDTIADYKIREIRQGDVILTQSGRRFILKFNYR